MTPHVNLQGWWSFAREWDDFLSPNNHDDYDSDGGWLWLCLVMMVILTMMIAMVIFVKVYLVCGIVDLVFGGVKLVPSVFPLENYTLGWKKSASAVVRMVTNMSIILIITIITTLMPCMQRLLFMGVQAVWPDSQVYLYSSKSWWHEWHYVIHV